LSGDVKTLLRQTSHDERAQALCANFVLQATNMQGLGTRLGLANMQFNPNYTVVGFHMTSSLECKKTKTATEETVASVTIS